MMEHRKLIAALKQLKVETGSLACLGCGYEHNCGIHGCAIIREAVEALESRPSGMVLLTLEQLHEMDRQPVWIVEFPDWGHWELSEDAADYTADRNIDFYGLTYPDPDGKAGLHKLGWIAYAYPLTHIEKKEDPS